MTQPIVINQRTATTVEQLVDRMNQAQETLRTYVEAVIGAGCATRLAVRRRRWHLCRRPAR